MNKQQKETIAKLRRNGISYRKISEAICVSVNTIKSYCNRNKIVKNVEATLITKPDVTEFCKNCGSKLLHKPHCKPKKFCNNSCRTSWWNAHPEFVNRKAIYNLICHACNRHFTAYGNKTRKFCSHACYIVNRFKTVKAVDV